MQESNYTGKQGVLHQTGRHALHWRMKYVYSAVRDHMKYQHVFTKNCQEHDYALMKAIFGENIEANYDKGSLFYC